MYKLRGNKNTLHFQTSLTLQVVPQKLRKTDIINENKNAFITTIFILLDKGIHLSSVSSNLYFGLAALHKWKDTGFDYTM